MTVVDMVIVAVDMTLCPPLLPISAAARALGGHDRAAQVWLGLDATGTGGSDSR